MKERAGEKLRSSINVTKLDAHADSVRTVVVVDDDDLSSLCTVHSKVTWKGFRRKMTTSSTSEMGSGSSNSKTGKEGE